MTTSEHDILQTAREAGMTILLDGRIGQQEYRSVSGSEQALQRFAHAVRVPVQHVCRRVRAARTPGMNPLVTARMRERIAAVLYRKHAIAPRARSGGRRSGRANRQLATTSVR
jgi:hypothetical protein